MKLNRRQFLLKTSLTAAGFGIIPPILKASNSSNEKIIVGLIGCGSRGFAKLKLFLRQTGVECGALCDINRVQLSKIATEVTKLQNKKPVLYTDFRHLIDNKNIDVVINAVPAGSNYLPVIFACEAGKGVYLENLSGDFLKENALMVEAQKKYNNIVQVGQWQRSDPMWQSASQYLRKGKLGEIKSIRAWYYQEKGNSEFYSELLERQKTHLFDFILDGTNNWSLKSVMATGRNFISRHKKSAAPDTIMAVYDFGSFNLLWDYSSVIKAFNFNRTNGVAITAENGMLVINQRGWEVVSGKVAYKNGFKNTSFHSSARNGQELHIQNFLESFRFKKKPNYDIKTAAETARVFQLHNISYRLGRKLFCDANNQKFLNDPEANKYIFASRKLSEV